MSYPEFSDFPPIPQRSAAEADFDTKMSALFQHFATTHRAELIALIDFLKTGSTIIGGALNATTVGLDTPAEGKFTALEADSLGGAAVQADPLDAGPGKLMPVGAFGLGHNTQNFAPNNDVSDGIPSGFYTTDASTTGTGNETSVNGSLLHVARATGTGSPGAFQLWQRGVGDLLYRHFSGGVPTDWAAIYTAGNILGAVSQSGGAPTGAVIERGSNANGEYVRLADGTQICTHTMPTVAADTAFGGLYSGPVETWNFPAAFFGTPTVSGGVDGGSTNTTYRWLALGDIQLTSISFRQLSATLNAYTRGTRLVAIGRWF
ncbi:hypothetical protein [Pseudophaeobacter sp. A-200-2]|uniref:hypothetical protein n=1 Tax=Pseudophaeobacter sp. A-200-2 TaxID=3098145 RepID=UPI0034D4B83F